MLEYAFMHPDLLPFIITQLASVLASVTLLGWTDVEQYRNVHKDILQFIQVIFLKIINSHSSHYIAINRHQWIIVL